MDFFQSKLLFGVKYRDRLSFTCHICEYKRVNDISYTVTHTRVAFNECGDLFMLVYTS